MSEWASHSLLSLLQLVQLLLRSQKASPTRREPAMAVSDYAATRLSGRRPTAGKPEYSAAGALV